MGAFTRATEFWGGMSGPARRLIIGAGVIFLIGVVLLMRFSGEQSWATVATETNAGDAAEVTQELQDQGITFRTQNGGVVVQVPSDMLDEARLALGSANLLSGTKPGNELLTTSSLSDTNATLDIKKILAAEGEATRQITELAPVKTANVTLAVPDDRLFVDEQEAGTASVVVELHRGQSLDASQVLAVQRIVAGGITNLEPEQVTVADIDGNLLEGSGSEAAGAGAAKSRMALQAAHERRIQATVDRALAASLGPGKAISTVNVVLDLDTVTQEAEDFDPASSTPLETDTTTERLEADGGGAGGVAGAAANTPPGSTFPAGAAGNGTTDYRRNQEQTRNGVDRTRTTTQRVPGTVTRQTISVQVSDELTAEQAATVEGTVRDAIGFEEGRDSITVQELAFAEDALATEVAAAAAEAPAASSGPGLDIMGIVKAVGAAIGLLLLLLFARKSLRRRQGELERTLPELLEAGPVSIAELEAANPKQLPGQTKTPVEQQMEDLAKRKPDDVAQLVRGWLLEAR